jgi:hypothetical protein
VPERLVTPLRAPSFRRLAAGKAISFLGDWLMVAALVGWVYSRTGSTGQVAALMIVRFIPPIIGGGLAASIADRLPQKTLLLASEAASAASVALVLGGLFLDSVPLVFAGAAAAGFTSVVGVVAMNALVPSLVSDGELAAANAALSIGQEIAMAVGALAGGALLIGIGAAGAVAANLASYLVSLALFTRIGETSAGTAAGRAKGGGIGAGIRYVRANATLVVVVTAFGLTTLATGLANANLPRLLAHAGLGAGGYGFGLAALAAGFTLGEAAIGVATRRVDARWLGWALAAMAGLFAGLTLAPGAAAALMVLFVFGCANGVLEVVVTTVVQREADPAYHGRVFGLVTTASRTTMLGAVAFAPVVARLGSVDDAILLSATALGVAALVVFGGLRRDPITSRLQPA